MRASGFGVAACFLAAAFSGAIPARAEVSAEQTANDISVIILGIIEGPDPIPQVIWEPVRDLDPELYLNPDGAWREDGRPDIATDPVTGWPHVVWAYNNGTDFDIAYSRWTGSAWSETEFLTASSAQELDPRVFVDDDAIHVVWWEQSSKAIRLIKRLRAGDWDTTEVVNGHSGMRPSVATWGGSILVASERTDGQGGKKIYLSTRLAQGSYSTQVVGSVPETAPLDVVLHSEQGLLWMDWRQSSTSFAYSEYSGSAWGAPASVPWVESSWLELEQIRLTIRAIVLSTP